MSSAETIKPNQATEKPEQPIKPLHPIYQAFAGLENGSKLLIYLQEAEAMLISVQGLTPKEGAQVSDTFEEANPERTAFLYEEQPQLKYLQILAEAKIKSPIRGLKEKLDAEQQQEQARRQQRAQEIFNAQKQADRVRKQGERRKVMKKKIDNLSKKNKKLPK